MSYCCCCSCLDACKEQPCSSVLLLLAAAAATLEFPASCRQRAGTSCRSLLQLPTGCCCAATTCNVHSTCLRCHPVRGAHNVLMQLIAVLLLKLSQLGCHTKVGQLHQPLQHSPQTIVAELLEGCRTQWPHHGRVCTRYYWKMEAMLHQDDRYEHHTGISTSGRPSVQHCGAHAAAAAAAY